MWRRRTALAAWARGATTESGAPVELMQGAGIALPFAQLRVPPPAPFAARQIHRGKLKRRLCGSAFDFRRTPGLIFERRQRDLRHVPHGERGRAAPRKPDRRDFGRQPVLDDRLPQRLEQAPLLAGEDGFEFAALVWFSVVADIAAGRAVAGKEIARPHERQRDFGAAKIDTVRAAALDVEGERAATPSLVRLAIRSEPARAQHVAVAKLQAPPGKLPRHTLPPSRRMRYCSTQ